MQLYKHQRQIADFKTCTARAFNTSDPGTGKTLASLTAYKELPDDKGAMLVLAPLSILQASWGDDIEKSGYGFTYALATAKHREKAFTSGADIIVCNHDGVKWLIDNPKHLGRINTVVVDEFSFFKHRTSDRSKALDKICKQVKYVWLLGGTPNSNSILDIWFPAFLLDKGERLGRSFAAFRSQVCTPVPVPGVPNAANWVPKPEAELIVADRLRDITIRFRLEDCIDLPENVVHTLHVELPKKIKPLYEQLKRESYLELQGGSINAIHAGARAQKLLQLCSGAVYGQEEGATLIAGTERYELIAQLCSERPQTVVAFNWRHQKDQILKFLGKYGLSCAVIDGSVPAEARTHAVNLFQQGKIRVILAHPQAAGHGLTLTNGCATIWASPTYNAEWFQQFNRRIYRAGQTKKTETILIAAKDTIEETVYEKLNGKLTRMDALLSVFETTTNIQKVS